MVSLSSGIPQGFIDGGIPQVRSSRASKRGEHSRVVLGQPNTLEEIGGVPQYSLDKFYGFLNSGPPSPSLSTTYDLVSF